MLVVQALMLLAGWAGPVETTPSRRAGQDGPDLRTIQEVRIEVDGASIRALCTDGARSVLLMHDTGQSADGWLPVLQRLDRSAGACAYDRRGSGGSTPAPGERGWYELVDELRRIHLALGFERDYVLVGHAVGGLYARVYAADRPHVGALLLVEPAHEDMLARVRAGLPEEQWESWRQSREAVNDDGVAEADIGRRARRSRLPQIPVTVLTATQRPGLDERSARFITDAARQVHASILEGVTAGRHVPASRSGQDVHLEQPDLVAEEIFRLVRITSQRRIGT